MTISANYDFAPSTDDILRLGLQLAGLVPLGRTPSAQQLLHARFFLDLLLKDMKNGAWMLGHREPTTTTLAANTVAYVLPADTIDLDGPMMLTAPGATTQTEVWPMGYDNYAEVVDKQTTGLPINFYAEKLAVVTLRFWPVPDKAYVASYARRRLMRNADSGTTLDATQGWARGISYQMAADMARASNLDSSVISERQAMADRLLKRAESRETESVDMQCTLPDMVG